MIRAIESKPVVIIRPPTLKVTPSVHGPPLSPVAEPTVAVAEPTVAVAEPPRPWIQFLRQRLTCLCSDGSF